MQILCVSVLTPTQKCGLQHIQKKPLTFFLHPFLINYLKQQIEPKELIDEMLLPPSTCNILLQLTHVQLVHMIDLLSMYDLCSDLKQIVDKVLLQKVSRVLSKEQLHFLNSCSKQPMKWMPPKLGLLAWDGSAKQLHDLLHYRGLFRLARGLVQEDASYRWHLLHRLDTGRAKIIQKELDKKQDLFFTAYFKNQVMYVAKKVCMTLFTLIEKERVHLASEQKVVPAKDISKLLSATQIVRKTKKEDVAFRDKVAKECELLKEQAELMGFEQGLQKWHAQIHLLEEEIKQVRRDMQDTLVPVALAVVEKIIGKELKMRPQTIVDIVSTAAKAVTQHRKIAIYVNQADLDYIEQARSEIKALFEHLESLSIAARQDVQVGGCVIETEFGIINAQLENLLKSLKKVFEDFFQKNQEEKA